MSSAFLGWHFHLIGTSFPMRGCKASFLVWCLLLPQGLNTHPQVCSLLWLLRMPLHCLFASYIFLFFPACITSCLMLFSALLIFCQPLCNSAPGRCWSCLRTCTHSPSLSLLHCLLLSGGLPWPLCELPGAPAASDPLSPLCYAAQGW